MNNKFLVMATMAAALLLASVPAMAHHSFAAEYDATKSVTLQGTVTKVEWMNPHIWVYLDAKDDSGATAKWQCEGGAPNALTRQGWTRTSLKTGDQVTVEGFRSKDGSTTCNARTVKGADGKKYFAGSNDDGAPGSKK
jgi:hypothetical protein